MKYTPTAILTTLVAFTAGAPVSLNPRAANEIFVASKGDANNIFDGIGYGADAYHIYTGDGSSAAGWPKMSQWVSFQQMFDTNANTMKTACTNLGMASGSDTTDNEIAHIYQAIQSVAAVTGVDHRFVLAILMQESLGCVRVYTTNNGVANPGLMQGHAGAHTCNPAPKGVSGSMTFPCPYDQIQGMIQDGVGGTQAGAGLAGCLNDVVAAAQAAGATGMDGSNSQVYYQAARFYNSGSVDTTNLDNGFSSTNCYASDIANRLTGWRTVNKTCYLDG
ncbi:hypothetical protein LTR64_007750 [Lithohypha guttulata]|uniref:uncharacterized protein n=1 Tax=Lithohypha guttulata TaxID=1690604 RepID=UPI002DE07D3F|nr:hypothetical protein LTR51_007260 [Lithohypha guttulata]